MSYTKQNFIPGQKLKASHLNHMEDYIEYSVEYIDELLNAVREIQESGGNVGIASIEPTVTAVASHGINVITVTLTDGTFKRFEIRNGHKGDTGDPGPAGAVIHYINNNNKSAIEAVTNLGSYDRDPKTDDLVITTDYYLFRVKSVNENTSEVEVTPLGNLKPVKGTDYLTDAEKDEMVSAVIDALPVYNGEVADV